MSLQPKLLQLALDYITLLFQLGLENNCIWKISLSCQIIAVSQFCNCFVPNTYKLTFFRQRAGDIDDEGDM